ncbi:acetyltransferase [Shinella sp. PSBB067]|uniref:GNAT family N-acetyltransferase n=1 Tax=unclassified Shinella TaxID=2643062 RepID=UPI00193BFE7C|nr:MULTISPECIES: GNAT family N-acetyltransferase [unclassified Shinella]QRI63078.1 acetyltransferase [Shinella sp. PSBB067]
MPTADAYAFRPVTDADLPMLERWLNAPHVRRWWGEPAEEVAGIAADFDDPAMASFIVLHAGAPFAYLQSYRIAADDFSFGDRPDRTIGIDQFIGLAGMVGIGHGPAMIDAFAARVFAEGVERIVLDPHPDNAHAIRAYEKAGFHAFDQRMTEDGPALVMARDRC